jgi:hypothetical protein
MDPLLEELLEEKRKLTLIFFRVAQKNKQVVHINYHTTTIKYKNIKMINLIHMIFILNYVFSIVSYAMS